eukprot:scaffold6790_cov69-Phaeocystis_antarctica.AAC.2
MATGEAHRPMRGSGVSGAERRVMPMSTMLKRSATAGCWATVVGDDGQLDDNRGKKTDADGLTRVAALLHNGRLRRGAGRDARALSRWRWQGCLQDRPPGALAARRL